MKETAMYFIDALIQMFKFIFDTIEELIVQKSNFAIFEDYETIIKEMAKGGTGNIKITILAIISVILIIIDKYKKILKKLFNKIINAIEIRNRRREFRKK